MRHLNHLALCAALACLAFAAHAGGEDLEACTWRNGSSIQPAVCDKLREMAARDAARAARDKAITDEAARESAEQQAAAAKLAEATRVRNEQAAAADRADQQAREAQMAKLQHDADLQEQRSQAAYAARMKTLRTQCGADFQRPQVGMALARAQQCVGDLVLVSQLNRKDGVASVYKAGPLFVTVMGDKVVQWTDTLKAR